MIFNQSAQRAERLQRWGLGSSLEIRRQGEGKRRQTCCASSSAAARLEQEHYEANWYRWVGIFRISPRSGRGLVRALVCEWSVAGWHGLAVTNRGSWRARTVCSLGCMASLPGGEGPTQPCRKSVDRLCLGPCPCCCRSIRAFCLSGSIAGRVNESRDV